MGGPAWLSWLLAAVMLGTGALHAGRLLTAGRHHRTHRYDVDATHLLMAAAMVAMLALPFGSRQAIAWSALLVVPALWFAGVAATAALGRRYGAVGRPARQAGMAGAMLFMLVVAAGRSPSGLAALGLVALLALVSAGLIREVRAADDGPAGTGPARPGTGTRGWLLRRGPSLGCQLAMTSAMGAMLVAMAG